MNLQGSQLWGETKDLFVAMQMLDTAPTIERVLRELLREYPVSLERLLHLSIHKHIHKLVVETYRRIFKGTDGRGLEFNHRFYNQH